MTDETKTPPALEIRETEVRHPSVVRLDQDDPGLDALAANRSRRVEHLASDYGDPPPDVGVPPLRVPEQQHFLFNLCHRHQRPRHARPGFRLLGAFPSAEEAAAFRKEHYPDRLKEAVWCGTMHQLHPLLESMDRQQDMQLCVKHIDQIIALHQANLEKRKRDFDRNVEKAKTGIPGRSVELERKRQAEEGAADIKASEAKFNAQVKGLPKCSGAMSGAQAVAGQKYAVVAVLPDLRRRSMRGRAPLEPLFAVLFAADTVKECENYAKYRASRSKGYENFTFDVVQMYAWCFPEDVRSDDIEREVFGNEKLDRIMQARRRNEAKLREVEEWHAQMPELKATEKVVAPNLVRDKKGA